MIVNLLALPRRFDPVEGILMPRVSTTSSATRTTHAEKPVSQHLEFAQALADATGAGECTSVPVEQVQAMLGGAAELLLASQRMSAGVALSHGFRFCYNDIASTVKDLVAKR
jgi:NAD dependent epimerase/dehydratase family enzyme